MDVYNSNQGRLSTHYETCVYLGIEPKVDHHDGFCRLGNNQFYISQRDPELEIYYISSYSNDTDFSGNEEEENNSTAAMKSDKVENPTPKNLKLNTDLNNEKNHTPTKDGHRVC